MQKWGLKCTISNPMAIVSWFVGLAELHNCYQCGMLSDARRRQNFWVRHRQLAYSTSVNSGVPRPTEGLELAFCVYPKELCRFIASPQGLWISSTKLHNFSSTNIARSVARRKKISVCPRYETGLYRLGITVPAYAGKTQRHKGYSNQQSALSILCPNADC